MSAQDLTNGQTAQPWDGGAVTISAVPFSYDAATDTALTGSFEALIIQPPLGSFILGVSAIVDTADGTKTLTFGSTTGGSDLGVFTVATGNVGVVKAGAALAAPVPVNNTGTTGIYMQASAAVTTAKIRGKAYIIYPNLS